MKKKKWKKKKRKRRGIYVKNIYKRGKSESEQAEMERERERFGKKLKNFFRRTRRIY